MTTESHKTDKPTKAIKVIKLEKPFTFGDKKITECRIEREPLAKDLKGLALAKGLADDQFILLGRISDLSTREIEEMKLCDIMNCLEALGDFLPESLRTGQSS